MKLNLLFTLNAVIALVFAIGFLVMPAQALSLYDVELIDSGLFITRFFGAALLGYAVLTWLVKDARQSEARDAVVLGLFVGTVAGFLVAVWAQVTGDMNQVGWINVVIYLVLALGYGYFQFVAAKD